MRDVWVQEVDSDGDSRRNTLTWYDNLDRVRLVVEYGGVLPSPLPMDPTATAPGTPVPPDDAGVPTGVAALFAATPKPLSVTETRYNGCGQPCEVRTYTTFNGSLQYSATQTEYDHADRPTMVRSPNAAEQHYAYDAKGRQILIWTEAAGVQVTKTETAFDDRDRPIITTHYERKDNTSGEELSETNAILTFTHTWYDDAGRVSTTANHGTNADTYTNGTEPTRGAEPADVDSTGATLITKYDYDEAGRQERVWHSDGTITEYEYDDLGRTLMVTENAGDTTHPELIRRTAYSYDTKGRLARIAAVFPDHPSLNWANLEWSRTDGSIQTTFILYGEYETPNSFVDGAEVVRRDWTAPSYSHGWNITLTPESRHNGWIGTVKYPKDENDVQGWLIFKYYSDGSVASRTTGYITWNQSDELVFIARSTLYYAYDDARRLVDVYIDDSAYYDPDGTGEPSWAAGLRVHHVHYSYHDNGQPDTVTAYSYATGSQQVVAQNTFTYNDLRDLTGEAQAHLGSVEAGTPTVAYDWAFSPLAAYNFHRLTGITYPARPGQGSGRTVALDYGNNTDSLDSALSRVTKLTDSALNELAAFTYAGSGRRVTRTFGNSTVAQSVAGGGGYTGLDRFGRVIDLHYTGTGGTLQRYQYGYDAAGNRLYARITQADDGAISHDNDRSYLYGYDALNRLILAERGQITPDPNGGTIDTGGGAPVPEARVWRLDNLGNWSGGEVFDPPHDDGTDGSLAWGPDADGNGVPDAGAWIHHTTDRSNRITQITKDTGAGPELAYDLAGNLVADGLYFLQYDGFNRLVQVNAIGTATFSNEGEITGGSVGDMVVQFIYDGLGRLIRTVRPQTGGGERIEDHYYDGVRRIQTDVTVSGSTSTDRQYIYSPDYVDEFVAQIDAGDAQNPDGHVFYMLQDGNYNVVALVNAAGAVVEQYAYRPYGSLVAVDDLAPGAHPVNTAGHQGLFYERLDGQGLAVAATGFYYNRNRFYSPALGRFLQRDPNETAMPLLTAMVSNGGTVASLFGAFDPEMHFGDGMNVYLYLGANPLNRLDPTGTTFSFGKMLLTSAIQSALGAALGGTMNVVVGGGSFADGDIAGAIGGAMGGAAGFLANSAFSASASGLFGTLMSRALIGGADGAVSAFGTSMYLTHLTPNDMT